MDQQESNISIFRTVLQQALDHALWFLEGRDKAPVGTTVSLPELRDRLHHQLPDKQTDAKRVINDLVAATNGGILGSTGGRFFGWAVGGTVPAALAADWLTATWNQNAALAAVGPAASVTEEVCGAWLKELFCLPTNASFALVSGCQMAHVTCLAAARHALLEKCGWDVERDGLGGGGAPRIHVLTSSERHGSIDRAVRLLGLGTGCIMSLAADENGRLDPKTLSDALVELADSPVVVVLQAGDLNIGAYDPFAELIPICRRHQRTWVHIDGAFGLWAAASPIRQHLLEGANLADSWATDGHKWLNVPYDCGYAFIRHPDAHRNSMSHRASYLTHATDARDQIDWNPEWSRRGRGVATYAAVRQLGKAGVADLVERCCAHAQSLVTQIGALPGAEVIWKSQINQGLVRFLDDRGANATLDDHNRRTDAVIAALVESGEAFFSGTTWRNMRCMRVSVLNWQTSETDVARVVAATARLLKQG